MTASPQALESPVLAILFVAPDESAMRVCQSTLRNTGYEVRGTQVASPAGLASALEQGAWEIVLVAPGLEPLGTGVVADIVHSHDRDLPFIVVSETGGEGRAVEAMREGAADFVSHDDISRLVPAVEREVREAAHRRRRRQAEQELAASEAKFRSLVEGSLQGVLVHRNERPLFVNQACAHMLGYDDPAEVLALESTVERLVAPEDRERLRGYVRARAAGRPVPGQYEYRGLRRDGSGIWLVGSARVIAWEGAPATLVTLVDVTERKESQLALERHEALLRTVIDTIPHRVFVKDADSRYLLVNEAFAQAAGARKEDLQGRHTSELDVRRFVPRELALASDRSVLENGEARVDVIEPFPRAEGEQGYVRTVKAPLRDGAGRVWGLVGVSEDITEHHRAQLEAAEAHARFRDTIELAPAAIYYCNAEGRLEVWNHWARELFPGLEDVVRSGMPYGELLRFIAPHLEPARADPEAWVAARLERMADPPAAPFEISMIDGRTILVQDRKASDGGNVVIVLDISERKRAEEALRASEANLRALMEQATDAIFVSDRNGRFLQINPAASEITGYSEAELYALGFADLIAPEAQASEPIHMRELLAGKHIRSERPLRRKDGRTVIVETTARLRPDGCIQGIVRDVTERHEADAALRESEANLRSVLEQAMDGISLADETGHLLQVNPAVCDITGYTAAELVGMHLTDLMEPAALAANPLRFEALQPGGRLLDERVLCRKDGGTIVVEASVTLRPDGKAQAIWRDVTDRRRAESELHESQRLLRAVFDTIPHFLFVKDREGRYVMVNRQFSHAWNFEPEALIGRHVLELEHRPEAERQRNHEHDLRVLEGNVPRLESIGEVRFGDGTERTVRTIKAALRDDTGTIYGLVGLTEDVTELERAQRAERENRRLLQSVFDTMPHFVTLKDGEGRYLMVNHRYAEVLASTPEALVGKRPTDLPDATVGPGQERQRAEAIDRQILAGELPRSDLVRQLAYADGELRSVRMTKEPIKDEQGRITGLVAVSEDISALDRAETEAHVAHARLVNAVQHLHAAFSLYDSEERLLVWNEKLYDLFPPLRDQLHPGVTYEEMLRLAAPELELPEDEREAYVQRRLAEFRDPPEAPIEQRLQDGRWVQVSDRRTSEGSTVSLRLDVTEQKRAEQALRTSEARFRMLTENAPDVIFRYRLGPERGFDYVSPVATAITGYTPDEHYADPDLWLRIAHPEDREQQRRMFEMDEDSSGALISARWEYKNAGWIWTEQRSLPVFDETGRLAGLEGIVRDVSARKELEGQLMQSQRMEAVGRLAGGIAHDFNNMLSVMGSYSTFVLEALPEGDSARDDMQVIQNAVDRSARLTRQLLAFSRRQVMRMETLHLNELVTNMEKILRRVIGEDVQLECGLAPDLGTVLADEGQMEQIVMNLAINARDAMPSGGRLTLETANLEVGAELAGRHTELTPGPYVMLAVSDTGVGMDETVRSQIFEPFFTTKGVGQGTGLGLATVYGIVKQMNGEIWVYSEPGRGTTFKIVLPRLFTDDRDADAAKVPGDSLDGTETVLLVEDEDMVRFAARRILEQHGYSVLPAADAEAADAICREHGQTIDLVLTDVVMPGQSGPQLVEELARENPRLRVLYMTGYTENTISSHLGTDVLPEIVHKPFSPEALLRKVRHVLDQDIP